MYNIKVNKGNVVNAAVEAIVTPANNNLMPGRGISKMVFYSAGENMLKACNRLGYCDTGCTIVTSGYNIPAEYIIHAVGPYWHGGYAGEAEDLASTYISIMRDVRKLKIKSVAIPAICTGQGGYPIEEAADIAISSVISYMQSHNMDTEVWFMCYDIDTMYYYRNKLNEGVEDISKYFGRKEININAKMNDAENKLLKKKLFKKTIEPEKEEAAVKSVLKRMIKKKHPECTILLSKKNENISMKTVEKHGKDGPYITADSLLEYSYQDGRMKLKVLPFCFTDTPAELESKKKYDQDKNENGIPDKFEHQNEPQRMDVVNVEDILQKVDEDTGNKNEVKRAISTMDSLLKMQKKKEANKKLNADIATTTRKTLSQAADDETVVDDFVNNIEEETYDWEQSTEIGEQLTPEESEQMDYMYDMLTKKDKKDKKDKVTEETTIPQNSSQNVVSSMPLNVLPNVAQNIPQNIAQSVSQNIPQNVPQNVPQNITQNTQTQNTQTQNTQQDVLQDTLQDVLQDTLQEEFYDNPQHVTALNTPLDIIQNEPITEKDIESVLNGIKFNDDEHYGEPLDMYPVRPKRKRNKSKSKYWPNFKPDYRTREYQKMYHLKKIIKEQEIEEKKVQCQITKDKG